MANILIFGASGTHGHYDEKGGWADRIKQHCAQKTIISGYKDYFEVYNLGRPGDTSKHLLRRFENEIKARHWEDPVTVIIIDIGMNDSAQYVKTKRNWVPRGPFKNNLKRLSEIARKYTNKIVFLGLTPVDQLKVNPIPWDAKISYLDKNIMEYDELVNTFCKKYGFDFIPLLSRIGKEHLTDGVHPNSKGHELIYKTVKDFLIKKKYI